MANSSSILDIVHFLPSELQVSIRDQCLLGRNQEMIQMCYNRLWFTSPGIAILPTPEYPWNAPVWFQQPWRPWTPLFYVYLWYLFNTYHVPLVFDPKAFETWGASRGFDYTLFDKFWFQVFGDDWRVVAAGQSLLHPLRGPIQKNCILIVKMNCSEGLQSSVEWVRNARGDFHRHGGENNMQYLTCQTTISRAAFLNTGNAYNPDAIATTPEATHVTWLQEDQLP